MGNTTRKGNVTFATSPTNHLLPATLIAQQLTSESDMDPMNALTEDRLKNVELKIVEIANEIRSSNERQIQLNNTIQQQLSSTSVISSVSLINNQQQLQNVRDRSFNYKNPANNPMEEPYVQRHQSKIKGIRSPLFERR